MEYTNAAEFLKEKGMLASTEKKIAAAPVATQAKPDAPVNNNPDAEKLNGALENSITKPAEPAKPEEVVAENPDKVDLTKEPEAGPSIQEKAKAELKVVKEIKKNKEEPTVDVTKNWFDDDTNADNADAGKTGNSKSTEISAEYKAKIEEYESLMKDPEMEAIIAAKKSGKNLLDFIQEVKPVDYNKMSPSELNEIRLKKLGVTDEELKEAMEIFNELPKWEQREKTASVKASLEQEQSERLKKFPQDAARQMEARNAFIKKTELDLDKKLDGLLGKELFGLKITDAEHNTLRNTVLNELAVYTPDGNIDIERSLELALWDKYKKEIVRANINKARASATEEIFKERVRPTAKTIETSRTPVQSDEEKAQLAKKAFLDKRAGLHN